MLGGMPPQKHIIDSGITSNQSSAQSTVLLAKAVINPDPYTNNFEVRAGSIVGAMTIELDVTLDPQSFAAAHLPVYFDWGLFYNINDQQTAPTVDAPMSSAGADMLNQLFHLDGTIINGPINSPTADNNVFHWRTQVAVPKSWSKMLRGDTIRLLFKFSDATSKFWIKVRVIYKEYYP